MHKPNNGPQTRNQYKVSLITLVTTVSRPTTDKEMAQSGKGLTSWPPCKVQQCWSVILALRGWRQRGPLGLASQHV